MGDLGDLANSVQDMGLAGAITGGLQKGMMTKMPFPDAPTLEAKKNGLTAECTKSRLGQFVVNQWATASGDNVDNWENFKETPQFNHLARFLVAKDTIKSKAVESSQFQEQRPIGRGAFGAVFLTFKKDTGAPMATKKMMKPIVKEKKMIKDALIERLVLEKVNSIFLVNLLYAWQDKTWIALILTLCPGGDLHFQIGQQYPQKKGKGDKMIPDKDKDYPGFKKGVLKIYTASMAIGLSHIHAAGFIYRDLKPHNVLLDLQGQVRISDMGLTADISSGTIKQKSGTRGYWSPETIKSEPYTVQPDWWSLGVTAFILNTDKAAFHGKTDEEKDNATCTAEIAFKHGGDREPEELQDLITQLCTVDPTKRLCCGPSGVSELKGHKYFAGFDWASLEAGTMQPLLVPDPNAINAPDAKDVAGFEAPKGVTWDDTDQEKLATWDFMSAEAWDDEAIFMMGNSKLLEGGGGGGGGCCTIS